MTDDEARAGTYNPHAIIDKWMKVWAELRVFEARGLTSGDEEQPRSYVVSMFPYPSGDLHMGHAEVYSISDAIARYRDAGQCAVLQGGGEGPRGRAVGRRG